MKYWWLEKYKNFRIVQIKELAEEVEYFLKMPKNYEKRYQLLKNEKLESLEEEDLLILLKKIVETKKVNNNSLRLIIEKLLTIPDNSFPKSDYDFLEILNEIKKLYLNPPHQEKLEHNNIAICYSCCNIFYVDKIKKVNKQGLCVCPYCLKTKLYFDNDYIPMNYSFVKFASLYYSVSPLGCSMKELKKIFKKSIVLTTDKEEKEDIIYPATPIKKIKPMDEKIISYQLYQALMSYEKKVSSHVKISCSIPSNSSLILSLILLTELLEVLSLGIYIKEIKLIFDKEKSKEEFEKIIKLFLKKGI